MNAGRVLALSMVVLVGLSACESESNFAPDLPVGVANRRVVVVDDRCEEAPVETMTVRADAGDDSGKVLAGPFRPTRTRSFSDGRRLYELPIAVTNGRMEFDGTSIPGPVIIELNREHGQGTDAYVNSDALKESGILTDDGHTSLSAYEASGTCVVLPD